MQRSILLQYFNVNQWQTDQKLSVMTKDEFTNIKKFINFIQTNNYFDALKLLNFHLKNYLNADAKMLAEEIVDYIDNEQVIE